MKRRIHKGFYKGFGETTKMASKQTEISTATPADVAADMEHHRATYGRFFNLLKWTLGVIIVVLAILFFVYY